MLFYKAEDGKLYIEPRSVPLIEMNIDFNIEESEKRVGELRQEIEELKGRLKEVEKREYLLATNIIAYKNSNGKRMQALEPVYMSLVKGLSMMGYKHVAMPDVYLYNEKEIVVKDLSRQISTRRIEGVVHGDTIVYSRRKEYTSTLYDRMLRKYVNGRELKWIASINIPVNGKIGDRNFQIYMDGTKIRLGSPGNPMAKNDIKDSLNGIFFIDRSLNKEETKQKILVELTKQLLK